MSIPGYRARTAANSKALAEQASPIGKLPIPPGLPSAQEIVAVIDKVMNCENFYSPVSQGALASLLVVRERFAASLTQSNGA